MSSKGGLTPAQAQFFATILKNMQGKPNVDWNKVAEQSGYSCAKTAQTRYGQIMKQLAVDAGETPIAALRQKKDKTEKKSKVGSGTNLGAMKITKSGVRTDVKSSPVKMEQMVQVWEEESNPSLDDDGGDEEA